MITSEVRPDGSVRLTAERGHATFSVVAPGVCLVQYFGQGDEGYGVPLIREIEKEIAKSGPVTLFFDCANVTVASTPGRDRWITWVKTRRQSIVHVHVLLRSKLMEMALRIGSMVLGGASLATVYADSAAFQQALAKAKHAGTRTHAT